MKAFIEYVVKSLVDHPEQVEVTEVDGERVVVFELRLNQGDIGKVIGKSGRTITAIRTLLTSSAARQGKRAMLEIIEPDRQGRSQAASMNEERTDDQPLDGDHADEQTVDERDDAPPMAKEPRSPSP